MRHKTLTITVISISSFILASCGGVTPVPSNTINTTPLAIRIATSTIIYPTITITNSPYPTFNPEEKTTALSRMYPTKPVHPTYATAEAPTSSYENFYQTGMYIKNLYLGKYIVRMWKPDGDYGGYDIVTISAPNQPQIVVNVFGQIKVHYLSGSDITGNGTPDLTLETAHGQWNGTQIYDLGDTPKLIFNLEGQFPDSDGAILANGIVPYFIDIDNNGSLEYVLPNYFFDSELDFCFSHKTLIFEYAPAKGYIYAVPKFYGYLNYTMPSELAINRDFRDDYDKFYSFCQLASEYAAFGDFSTANAILDNNLNATDAENAENIIDSIFSRLGMDVP